VAFDIDGPVLRLIDANANRAREALRVMEDCARFVLNDAPLSLALKELRHELADALKPCLAEAITHRDTPGDVGTTLKTPDERSRRDIADVVTAAGKRLAEALRSIEEYLKIGHPIDSGKIEALRYRSYDLEKSLAQALGRDPRIAAVRLYVLITESACRHPWLQTAKWAIDGGADCIQLREKTLDGGELLSRSRQLAELCKSRGVLCIINDRPDIARLANADGVHLGQSDLPPKEARKILGSRKLIGISTHNLAQATAAAADGADYIGVGPIFKSPTKPRDFVAGLEYASAVAATDLTIPKIAIAGIGLENISQVLATGVKAVAVTSAVLGCDDVRAAAAKLKEKLAPGR
jgi:thiamine-phosphate pyrophosphorylase